MNPSRILAILVTVSIFFEISFAIHSYTQDLSPAITIVEVCSEYTLFHNDICENDLILEILQTPDPL